MTAGVAERTGFEWRCILYRLWDENDQLLYIGRTNNLDLRMTQHRSYQPWWPQIATVTVEFLPDRETLSNAERAAILAENPLHNHQRYHPDSRPESLERTTGVPSRWADLGEVEF